MPIRHSFGLKLLLVSSVLVPNTLGVGCTSASPSLAGTWDGAVVVDGIEIPFQLDIAQDDNGVTGVFVNGEERVTASTSGRVENDTLHLVFDHYATQLEATWREGRLAGLYDRGPTRTAYPFYAVPFSPPSAPTDTVPAIAGVWHIEVESSKGEKAWRFITRQSGADVSAAILRVDGDTGTLSGRYTNDGTFVLSHFSGTRPLLLEVRLAEDGSLEILRNRRDQFIAVREEVAASKNLPQPTDPNFHSTVKNPHEPFLFRFPDLNGRLVANTDPRFQEKVVIVSITGTWCPNCHDEAPFLSDLYRQYRALGLEIVAISFEEADQLENPTRVRAFISKYGIEYPMLLAGLPEELGEKIPQIENLNSFPTTIFLGRDGRVRAVHAGFPSVASGSFHTEARKEIRSLVENLVAGIVDNAAARPR